MVDVIWSCCRFLVADYQQVNDEQQSSEACTIQFRISTNSRAGNAGCYSDIVHMILVTAYRRYIQCL